MAEHRASVTVQAPVHQVYELFTHFNDYPKFMSHVKEVTYYDEQRSHWVADIIGKHEWDALNENWIEDRQVGWRSIDGLQNWGRVTFAATGEGQTLLTVIVDYNPPAGLLGAIGESLGAGKAFENALKRDLTHFARMVQEAPPGALDPESSNYLFHHESAAATGTTTRAQDETMEDEAMRAGSSASRALRQDSSRNEPRAGAPLRDDKAQYEGGSEVPGGYENMDVSVTNPGLGSGPFGEPKT